MASQFHRNALSAAALAGFVILVATATTTAGPNSPSFSGPSVSSMRSDFSTRSPGFNRDIDPGAGRTTVTTPGGHKKKTTKQEQGPKDAKSSKKDAKLRLGSTKSRLDETKIDRMRDEASERFARRMDAANLELYMGAISTALQMLAGNSAFGSPVVDAAETFMVLGPQIGRVSAPSAKFGEDPPGDLRGPAERKRAAAAAAAAERDRAAARIEAMKAAEERGAYPVIDMILTEVVVVAIAAVITAYTYGAYGAALSGLIVAGSPGAMAVAFYIAPQVVGTSGSGDNDSKSGKSDKSAKNDESDKTK